MAFPTMARFWGIIPDRACFIHFGGNSNCDLSIFYPESSSYSHPATLLHAALRTRNFAKQKKERLRTPNPPWNPRAQALYGEYDFIFFGDNGQADARGTLGASAWIAASSFQVVATRKMHHFGCMEKKNPKDCGVAKPTAFKHIQTIRLTVLGLLKSYTPYLLGAVLLGCTGVNHWHPHFTMWGP